MMPSAMKSKSAHNGAMTGTFVLGSGGPSDDDRKNWAWKEMNPSLDIYNVYNMACYGSYRNVPNHLIINLVQ